MFGNCLGPLADLALIGSHFAQPLDTFVAGRLGAGDHSLLLLDEGFDGFDLGFERLQGVIFIGDFVGFAFFTLLLLNDFFDLLFPFAQLFELFAVLVFVVLFVEQQREQIF